MKVEAPCRLGERFTCEKSWSRGRFVLTGVDLFRWESRVSPDTVLCGKKDPYESWSTHRSLIPRTLWRACGSAWRFRMR